MVVILSDSGSATAQCILIGKTFYKETETETFISGYVLRWLFLLFIAKVEERVYSWNILYIHNRYQLVTGLSSRVVVFHLSYY